MGLPGLYVAVRRECDVLTAHAQHQSGQFLSHHKFARGRAIQGGRAARLQCGRRLQRGRHADFHRGLTARGAYEPAALEPVRPPISETAASSGRFTAVSYTCERNQALPGSRW